MHHFLGRLYQAQYRATKSGWMSLTCNEKMDLHLMICFLDSAHDGLSMNLLTFRKPTHFYRSDASEFGLGGYNITTSKAWCFEIPVDCHLRTSLNSLEFIACMITIWVDILSSNLGTKSCLLCKTDRQLHSLWVASKNKLLRRTKQSSAIVYGSSTCMYPDSIQELLIQSVVPWGEQ